MQLFEARVSSPGKFQAEAVAGTYRLRGQLDGRILNQGADCAIYWALGGQGIRSPLSGGR